MLRVQDLNTVFLYLLQVNVAITTLFIFYKLVFNKDTFFGWRRYTLLGIMAVSLLLPFIPNVVFTTPMAQPVDNFIATFAMPEFLVINNERRMFLSWVMSLELLYIAIALILTLRTLYLLISLTIKLACARKVSVQGVSVCQLKSSMPPFSFFKWICMPIEGVDANQQKDILIHEQAHINKLHSIDVVLFQLFANLNWLNPIVWWMRREVRINHEYQADEAVICSGTDKKGYQYHLLNASYPTLAAAKLYSNFNVLPLKKRIMMLNKPRTKSSKKSKYFLFLPMIALLLLMVNCTSNAEKEIMGGAQIDEIVAVSYADGNAQPTVENELPNKDANGEPFDIVEQMPEFPGGQKQLMEYLSRGIKYPVDAQKNGIQGRVIVQFTVNKDGHVSDAIVARGVDADLDKEALRIVKAMPNWAPGMHKGEAVNVRYTIPVNFRLQ